VKRLALAALWMLLVVILPSAAFAHASLTGSEPADGAVLAQSPAELTLSFNEPVEPLTIRIVEQNGTAIAIENIRSDGPNLILTPPAALADGAHVVSWRVISADGHPVGGSYTFWVGQRGDVSPLVVSSDDAGLRGAIWLTRLMIYLGLFVGAGGAFFVAWIAPSLKNGPRMIAATVSLIGLAALLLSIGLQGLDALAEPATALSDWAVWRQGIDGSFGLSAAIAAMALILALLSLRFGRATGRLLSLGALLGVGVALAVTGHAATAQPRYLTAPAVFLHGISLAFWIGALMPLAFAMRGAGEMTVDVLMRFSRIIPLAVAALLASGLLLATVQLGRLDALWTTSYGEVLMAKLALVALLLAVALWNRLYLTPQVEQGDDLGRRRMRRSIVAELVLVAGILGVVGLWRFTPPPRALAVAADSFFTHLHTGQAMADVTVSPGHAGPVAISIQLRTPDEAILAAKAVSVTLANPEAGIEPATAEARPAGEGEWRATMTAPVAGRWTMTLDILISDFDQISVEAPIVIK